MRLKRLTKHSLSQKDDIAIGELEVLIADPGKKTPAVVLGMALIKSGSMAPVR